MGLFNFKKRRAAKTARILRDAANIIEQRGINRGELERYKGGPVCALGALAIARYGKVPGDGAYAYATLPKKPEAEALQREIGPGSIWSWSDAAVTREQRAYLYDAKPVSAAEEVTSTMRRVADKLEANNG